MLPLEDSSKAGTNCRAPSSGGNSASGERLLIFSKKLSDGLSAWGVVGGGAARVETLGSSILSLWRGVGQAGPRGLAVVRGLLAGRSAAALVKVLSV